MSKRAKAKLVEARSTRENGRNKPSVNPATSGRQEPTLVTEQGGVSRRLAVTLLGKVLAPPYGKLLLGGWSANTKIGGEISTDGRELHRCVDKSAGTAVGSLSFRDSA